MEQLKSLLTNREGQYSRAIAQLDTSGTSLEKATQGLLKITQKILS